MSRLTKPFRRGALCGLTLALALPVTAHASVLTQGAEAGLVARYALDQTSGTVVGDDSGNGRDATLQGGATWRGTEGLQLGGANGYVDLPDNLLRDLSAITVSIQVRIDADQATPYFIWGLGNTTNNAGNGYIFTTGNAYRSSIATGNYTTERTATAGRNLTRGVWKTLTYTLGGGTAIIYEDGVEAGRLANVTTLPSAIGGGTTTANYIGRSQYTSDRYLKGSVRDFRIYDYALTAAEVHALGAVSDDQIVARDIAALDLGDTSARTTNLTLPAAGPNGAAIAWASSNEAVVSSTGVVERPPNGSPDATAVLTATVSKGTASQQRPFTITVPAMPSDAAMAAEAAAALAVYDASDIRGNITLPTTGVNGAEVAWTSSAPTVITAAGVVHRPANGAAPAQLELTATVRVGTATSERKFAVTVRPLPKSEPYAGYAFSYFTGEGTANGEQIYFAASRGNDALHWDELNGGQPALTSTLGDKGVRDPFIIRSPEGDKFYLIATDLKIYGNGNWDAAQRSGSKYIEVWESTDLVHWSDQRHVRVSPDTAGNTWAPEAYYSDELGAYVVFWASKLYAPADTGHTGDTYNRMMYATTRDFRTFSAPQVWIDPGYSVIDSTVIKNGDTYYRFTKDERNNTSSTPCSKFILEQKSTDLLDLDWDFVADCIGKANADGPGINQGEGPTIFKSNTEEKWYLLIDEFGGRGYVPFESADPASGKWKMSTGYQLPARPRHGTVLSVTQAELNRLRNIPDPVQATPEGLVASYSGSGDGTALADATGHGYDGVLTGDVSRSDGALQFGGTNGHVKLPDNLMAGLDAITVATEVWIDPAQATPYFIWGLGNTVNNVGNGYLFTTGNGYRTSITAGDYTGEQTAGTKDLSRGGWHQLTYTLAGGVARLYADGVEVARNEAVTIKPGDIGAGRTTANYIGRSLYGADRYFKGKLKSFSLWNRALSAAEVRGLPGNQTTITGVSLASLKTDPVIDAAAGTVLLPLQRGTDRTRLAPMFTIADGATLEPGNGGTRDFTQPVTYTVRGADGSVRTWTVRAVVMGSPSLPGYNADPNIVRFGDTYYIYGTTDGFPNWSGTTFKTWSSKDLVHWTEHGTILDLGPDVSWADGRAWAPAAIEKNGKYYLYFCADAKIGVAVSDSPTGPFVDSGAPLVAANPDGGQAIDPAVFTDDDGQSYLYWGNGNAYVVPLNTDMVSFDAAKRKRLTGLTGFREGLFMHKRAGVYYLTWSIDDTRSENYRVGYATGTSPLMDGLQNRGEILTKDPSLGILGTGHSSIIQIPGTDDWYIAYHRFAIPGGDGTHREVTIDRLRYAADGSIEKVVPTLEGIDPLPTTVHTPGEVGGTVPATLSLTLGAPASFGAFVPGVARDYSASTTASVISSAGDAALTVSDPSATATGHLVNGTFALPQALRAGGSPLPATLKSWAAPVSNDVVPVTFTQSIGASDALRTGQYAKTLVFTLSTTSP